MLGASLSTYDESCRLNAGVSTFWDCRPCPSLLLSTLSPRPRVVAGDLLVFLLVLMVAVVVVVVLC